MVQRNCVMRFGTIGLLCVAATGLSAMSGVSNSLEMSGYVPLICNVGFEVGGGEYNSQGIIQLGKTREFCNSGHGYRVYATPFGTDSGAKLIVENNTFAVTNGKEMLLANVSGPARTSRIIYLDVGSGQGGGSLSLRIEAN